MIGIAEADGAFVFTIRFAPRASHDSISSEFLGPLKIGAAPPVEDGDNESLRRFLAARLNAPASAVRIVAGAKNRIKRIEARGVAPAHVRALDGAEAHRYHRSPENRHVQDLKAIQTELRSKQIDGWLFYDHHHRDPIAERILGLDKNGMATRRWFYFIPARGEPRKLVHRVESQALDSLPGRKFLYSGWEELQRALPRILKGSKTVAMQYSPLNNIPYVGLVDAGTVELVRKVGKRVVSSADFVQKFEACWTFEQLQSHREAGKIIDRVTRDAFVRAGAFVREKRILTEFDLQQWILEQFRAHSLVADDAPNVAVGPNSGNPHYEPKAGRSSPIRMGDLLLLDVWGKLSKPGSVYYDITWIGYLGSAAPPKYSKVFQIVKTARDSAVNFVKDAVAAGRSIRGWEVDGVAREVIRKAGYAKYFTHRTGHSIGQEVHGNGANMDGLETRDDRCVVPHTCFSIEPGIYLPEFGIRSEVNVYVGARDAEVTGAVQEEIIPILS